MRLKTINIYYWIFTGLLTGMMLFSSIPNALATKDAVAFLNGHLHYPLYIIPFIGVAKLLGVIAILIPGFHRVKEWAYAGFAIDLTGAAYSGMGVGDPIAGWIPVYVLIIILVASYIFHYKRLKARGLLQKQQ